MDHRVKAVNHALESENKIHDDEVARRYGFRGGLVPGVTVYGYLTYPATERWGRAWLERGTMAARFVLPVYEGDEVVVTAVETDDGGLDLQAVTDNGVCATGRATLPAPTDAAPPPDPSATPVAPLPPRAERPSAGSTLVDGLILGTSTRTWRAADAPAVLDELGDDLALYADGTTAHPGWIVRGANDVLSGSVLMGPWMHVSTDAVHYGVVGDGETLAVRGRVVEVFERKGHRFVALDAVGLVGDRVVWSGRHVAIYEPRQTF